jgi:hypothetical protein
VAKKAQPVTQEKKENDVLIEEMIASAEKVPTKGVGEVVDRGDEKEHRPPIVMTHISGNDKVYIYDTETGERSECLRYTLSTQLKKKRENGKPYFTTINPNISPKRGQFTCLLHKDRIEREHYDELGLATCKKSNLTSVYQVERHMQKKHPAEWAVIKDERARQEKEEDKEFQRALLSKTK